MWMVVQARRFFRDLTIAVEYIHNAGVIHKDIKPANCLITSQYRLKVCDFGVAEEKKKVDAGIRREGGVNAVGTPAFQTPEVASGAQKLPDFTVDIWAMGITLYFMTCAEVGLMLQSR
mmetsp:Transcript_11873/g.33466  ORF Transcript_11873/g.33466 Transcript_11873/m.33466 type:complete len:118 (+) Transcript_11873:49-402(+)